MTETLPATTEATTAVSLFDGVLTDREFRLVTAYLGEANFNATKAAVIAGYAEKSAHVRAHEVMKRKHVRERIDAALDEFGMTAREWMFQTTKVARMRLDECVKIVAVDRHGNPVAAVTDASAKMKALEMIGKAHGAFTERIDVNVKSVEIRLNGLDLERLGMSAGDVIDAEGDVQ